MPKILFIRRNPEGGNDGTVNYCQGLRDMFRDDADIEVLPIPNMRQVKSLFKYTYEHDTLRQQISQADIVHINGYTALGTVLSLRMAKEMGKKVVYTAHWHPFEYLNRPLAGKLFFRLMLAPQIRRCADIVTAINNEDEAFFNRMHPCVKKIPHWNVSTPPPATPVQRRQNMILFVGRLNDQVKGIDHLLALPRGKYRIHCVGKGSLPTDRTDFIQHQGISDQELSELYRQAALVVIPSRYEAFSFVALEALSKGTPVLMSNRVRIADYLEGISGYDTFRQGDMTDFRSKIDTAMQMTVDVARIADTFSIDKIRTAYKQLYLSLTNPKR